MAAAVGFGYNRAVARSNGDSIMLRIAIATSLSAFAVVGALASPAQAGNGHYGAYSYPAYNYGNYGCCNQPYYAPPVQ
jgi:hypothetical protein